MNYKITCILIVLSVWIIGAQESQVNTTICWDASSTMAKRDLDKDFTILEKIFERNSNQIVQLIVFNIDIEDSEYIIRDGDWKKLKMYLENVTYDGATIFSSLKNKIKYNNVYVFTDGKKTLSKNYFLLTTKHL